jgi:hypothetical protein
MRIDFNRICKLAGINDNSTSRSYLNEGAAHDVEKEGHDHMAYEADDQEEMMKYEADDLHGEGDMAYEAEESEAEESEAEESEAEESEAEEVVEVNISELMSEIRRAKKIIKLNEKKSRDEKSRRQSLKENKLKRVIAREVQSVLAEMQEYNEYDSAWVYGDRKPRNSKQGHTAQGSFIPGVGFRRK